MHFFNLFGFGGLMKYPGKAVFPELITSIQKPDPIGRGENRREIPVLHVNQIRLLLLPSFLD